MATPKIIADFETQLATALAVGGTSFTLASATDDDGVALPTGKYYFTIDNASSQKEYVVGTVTGTAVTAVSSVSRQGIETSGVARAHRIGASVIMTDFMTYKNYIDETTLVSAPDASTIQKGLVEIATLAQVRAGTGTGETGAILVVSPTELDDMTSQAEKAALAGGGNFGTPDTDNKFVTEDYLASLGALDVQEFSSSGTWTKPLLGSVAIIEIIGAGGSGGASKNAADTAAAGGSGGAYRQFIVPLTALSATETATIGAGGAAVAILTAGNSTAGNSGGVSWFKSTLFQANGGNGGSATDGAGSVTVANSTGGAIAALLISEAGAAGGGATSSVLSAADGVNSIYSGAGGGGSASNAGVGNTEGTGGTSALTGSIGGAGASTQGTGGATGVAGQKGAGGGGATVSNVTGTATSGAGGPGYIRVTVI